MVQKCYIMLVICAVFYSKAHFSGAQDVFSCGGFIKSPVPLQFSKIMVKLFTREMNLKYETDCAPNNGYYMIPVYSKGNYVIKVHPPAGWSFEPEQVELSVDGVNDPCTTGVDINFNFRGFSVSGKVVSKGSTEGPNNFEIAIRKEDSATPLLTTKTTDGGKYLFNGILPGQYIISSVDKEMCLGKKHMTVNVIGDSVIVAQPLEINGYSITGTVKNEAQGVANAMILLFSEVKIQIPGCETGAISDFTPPATAAGLNFVCRTPTSADGTFTFSCVPAGDYVLTPYYKTDGVTFDLIPKSAKVSVGHAATHLKETFKVAGFTVPGHVLWHAKGGGVNGADVFLNGKFVTQTNQNGNYVLERMTSGKYKISAKRDGVEFSTSEIELSPTNHHIPDIVATTFQVCGNVSFHSFPSSVPKLTQRKLLLTNTVTKDVLSITTDQDGAFCRMLPRGSYVLEPQILPNEKQAGIILIPKERKIQIVDKPVTNVNFAQFDAKLSGNINCLGLCSKIKLQLTFNGEEMSTLDFSNIDTKTAFQFDQLLPGSYVVKIVSEYYCWEKNELTVNVEQADVTNVNFRQTGFLVTVSSTNAAKLSYTHAEADVVKGKFDLRQGTNTFCLPAAGSYRFSIESCHQFEPKSLTYNTKNPTILKITAVKHLVTGTITTKEYIDDIHLTIQSNKGAEQRLGPLTKASNETSNMWVYDFEYWAEPGEEVTFVPSSGLYLFSPEQHVAIVDNDCRLKAINFVGQKGLFLTCRIEPHLKNVQIVVTKPGDKAPFEALTNERGECSIGPLKTFEGYEVAATLQGYSFESISGRLGHFKAFKLSELVIRAVDENKKPLPGVLISLSGSQYRSNNLTDDTGAIQFFGLTPGEYFLRPVLKEFSFQPATHMVKIVEGSAEKIDVVGKRVAYSCSGLLRYLSGQPVVGAVVEAVSSGCNFLQEEALTGEDGTFRIRGLQPGCDYILRIKGNQDFPPTYPRQLPISVKTEDTNDVVLVLRPHITTVDVTGRVDCEREALPFLRVSLFKEESPDALVHSLSLQSSFFFFPPIAMDNATYIARLDSTLNPSDYENIKFPEITFKADGTFRFLEFQFRPKKKSSEAEISKTSYFALPLTIIIILIAYHYEKVLPLAKEWSGDFGAFLNNRKGKIGVPSQTATMSEAAPSDFSDLISGEAGVKKKVRARKT